MRNFAIVLVVFASAMLTGCGGDGASESKVEALRTELDELRAQFDQREKSLESMGKYVIANRERIVAVERQVNSLSDELEVAVQAVSQSSSSVGLQDAIAALEARKGQLEKLVEAAENRVNEAQKRYTDLAFDVAIGKTDWAEDPRPAARAALERFRDELQAARDRVQAVDDEVAYIRTYKRLP